MAVYKYYLDAAFSGVVPGAPTKSQYLNAAAPGAPASTSFATNRPNGLGYSERYGIINGNDTLPSVPYRTTARDSSFFRVITYARGPWGYQGSWSGNGFQACGFPIFLGVLPLNGAISSMHGSWLVPPSSSGLDNWNHLLEYVHGGSARGVHRAAPIMGYIWRPSTQSVVGFLWYPLHNLQSVPYYTTMGLGQDGGLNNAFGMNPNTLWSRPGTFGNFAYNNSNGQNYHMRYDDCSWVNGIADGDQLIVEWWGLHVVQGSGAYADNIVHPQTTTIGAVAFGGRNIDSSTYGLTENGPSYQGQLRFTVASDPRSSVDYPNAATGPVELTAVTPMAGPKVRLTFSGDVAAPAPTIGAATAGLGVTSVTEVDATHLDLNTDYPPTHPIGEAEPLPSSDENVRRW